MQNLVETRKNRDIAMFFSAVPGVAQVYLRMYKSFIWIIFGYMGVLSLFILPNFIYPTLSMHLSLFILIISFPVLSVIDVEYQCDKLGLPYRELLDGEKRGHTFCIKNFGRTYRLWTLIPAGLGVIISLLSICINGYSICSLIILIIWCLIGVISEILIRRYRNVTLTELLAQNPMMKQEEILTDTEKEKRANIDGKIFAKYASIVLIIGILFVIVVCEVIPRLH